MIRHILFQCIFPVFVVFAIAPVKQEKKPATAPTEITNKKPTSLTPAAREDEDWWKERFKQTNEIVKKGEAELLFIGDSITQGWEGEGADAWKKYYGNRKAVNLGFSGDRTQHVLWRIDHGNVDGVKPKAAVIMIGTNNSNGNDNTDKEIAAGIAEIVNKLQRRLPNMKILLLAVFPRSEKPDAQRGKIDKANAIIQLLDDGKTVHYLDIGKKFMNADGSISKDIMPDYLHLSKKGYEIWADAIETKLKELLK
ncbi:MAG: GDSL family lipase [Planctomycetes bacterium]|nr:GDSL family lipase [Planctomycetota bacterium]